MNVGAVVMDSDGGGPLVRHIFSSGCFCPDGSVEKSQTAVEALANELRHDASLRLRTLRRPPGNLAWPRNCQDGLFGITDPAVDLDPEIGRILEGFLGTLDPVRGWQHGFIQSVFYCLGRNAFLNLDCNWVSED